MEKVYFTKQQEMFEKANELFDRIKNELQRLLPGADIQHVGSTAIPGSLTKGDLDIQIRVAPDDFARAAEVLSRLYETNKGSIRTETFHAFQDERSDPPLGIQLTAIGSEYDFFWKVRDVLLMNEEYRSQYDDLKKAYAGKNMDDYREAKNRFMEWLMETPEYSGL